MILESLTLSQFRCWTYEQFSFAPGLNYLVGPNGSGKTSVLEAINYLSTGRSVRATHDATCVQWGKESFSLRAEFKQDSGKSSRSLSLSYGSDRGDRRRVVKLDDELVRKLSELRRVLITVLFTPDDLIILKGGPSDRRSFIDALLSQVNESYIDWLREYEEVRKQRNSLLKSRSPDHVLLDQYDERLVELGTSISEARRGLFPVFQEEVETTAPLLLDQDGIETISLEYRPDVSPSESFAEVLDETRGNDIEKGYTTRGPQRDDWTIKIKDRPVDRFASQGQLRALLLTLKLAANSVIIKRISKVPILLLDDVESELDEDRQQRVLGLLRESDSQVIMTGTGHFEFSADGESEKKLTLEAR